MSVRQGIVSKKKAKNKNAKYTYAVTKTAGTTTKNGKTTKKYSYIKKILIGGKYRYYYN